jgi:hypothetical protein
MVIGTVSSSTVGIDMKVLLFAKASEATRELKLTNVILSLT